MPGSSDTKLWLHKDLPRRDKLLLILSTFDAPCQVKEIVERAGEAGFKEPQKWNVSTILGRTKGLAINTPAGWEIADSGKQHLKEIGVSKMSLAAAQVAVDLRAKLANIKDENTRAFMEESIKCYEFDLYRSAIVMSWLAAVHILHRHIQQQYLYDFNQEASRIDSRWKPAKTTDDLGKMKESDFLDRIVAISVIGKNVKKELKNCLDLRNGCGHPNSMKIGANTVARHLEVLLLNVFEPFS